ncbi:MAG TPA: OmpA family protein [Thermomonas sp.]|nr:OmpA family protein [Thermomonas sp.]
MISKMRRKHVVLSTALIALMAALPGLAADGDKGTLKGLITSIKGDTITIRDGNNAEHTITVSPSTVYKKKKGLAAIRFEKAEKGALIPGLPIIADGIEAGTGLNATAISFESEEFRTAQQIQAGVAPTNARMNDFGTYEALATAEVFFDSGSTKISEKGKADLLEIAKKAKDTKDFRIVVQGFTDSTGDPAKNQRLSTRRAAAVTNFLQQKAGVSPGRVQAGDGMGIAADAGTGSNAGARKVVVKLVVDKGVQGGN